jgi:hypothetical protein
MDFFGILKAAEENIRIRKSLVQIRTRIRT